MSKATARRRAKKPLRHARAKPATKPVKQTSDGAIYGGLLLIGAFTVAIAWLLTDGDHWQVVGVAYVLILLYFLNAAVWDVYHGRHDPNWKQALARLPMRFAGYGTKQGKPLEAAHDQPVTRTIMLITLASSVLIAGGLLAWAIVPRLS